ncbi:MatE domain-containing protein [Cephalotus follicularis]|uniref:Protein DETOXIFICATION n=1 Tax=Cephalotus follicularis TaxID=3775 RepID=A0A1Q3B2Z8_CEPFO|nr:MatE domain-containing protein [Cephalotus follicularis]
MQITTINLNFPRPILIKNPITKRSPKHSLFSNLNPQNCVHLPPKRFKSRVFTPQSNGRRFLSDCIGKSEGFIENDDEIGMVLSFNQKEEIELGNQSMWNQIKEILMFTGPATGLWICGPLMSLIDTAVIGQGSSIELAALGPGTVICDYMSYVFMFLSIATSNMVATSLARQDKNEVQHQISILLFVGLACGFFMFFLTRFFGSWAVTAFVGQKNAHLVPAAKTYVQIRGYAWPAVLVGWIAQSASLGMKDSLGPLKALAIASAINGIGDVVLCSFLGYGIAGAAWATMVSQVVAAYMMIEALNKRGYKAYVISVPSVNELFRILELAAPVFVTMMSKVAFYTLIIYFATSMGTHTVAAHQVMVQTYSMCSVWGEPLSQTAQSFMPELLYGAKRSLTKARMLLKSLVMIGATLGIVLGTFGTVVPWLLPNVFTPDQKVIQEMHKVLIPYYIALAITPSTHSLEGTLLAGRDLRFLSLSMSGCFSLGGLVLLLVSSRGFGLPGCWYALVGFQWARFFLSLHRLLSPDGVLFSEDMSRYKM